MGGRAGEATVFPAEGPAGFDPAHPYADPAASLAQREHIVREKLVKVETAKVRRRCVQRLRRCRGAPRASARTRVSRVHAFRTVSDAHPLWARAQILRERVQQCYRKEGVNHYENCREVRRSAAPVRNEGFWRARR
jgi:NADH dehydrogenase (ubiquinone) 1 beta subcomplex subunit 10